MIILTVVITKQTAALYNHPTPELIASTQSLLGFLSKINVTQIEEGFSFHAEVAKDDEGNTYRDIYITVNSQFVKNDQKIISNGGIGINVQPLIDFLSKVLVETGNSLS